jgi:hypothetical protein
VGYFPVLAAGASKITANTSQGKPARTGIEMEHWFFLYGIYRDGRDFPIYGGIQSAFIVYPGRTPASLALGNGTSSLADMASDFVTPKLFEKNGLSFHSISLHYKGG